MAKLNGAKKKAFLERMAKGRKKAQNTSVRKAKKVIAKGFTKPLAAEWAKKKRKAKKRTNPKPRKVAKKRTPAQEKRYQILVQKFGPVRAAQLWKATNPAPKKKRAKKNAGRRRVGGPIKCAKCGKGYKTQGGFDQHKCKTAPKKANSHRHRGKRRNSELSDAEAMFETFHQMPPKKIVDFEQLVHYQSAFAQLGKLKKLLVYLDDDNPDFPFTQFSGTQVACTPDGRNIYFLNGDQSIDLEALDIASDKDMIELGPCMYIEYYTVKGFHDFEPTNYWHLFGEEDEIRPILCYDRLNKQLFLMGGNYTVKYEGIVN